jgi:hypothetical protein
MPECGLPFWMLSDPSTRDPRAVSLQLLYDHAMACLRPWVNSRRLMSSPNASDSTVPLRLERILIKRNGAKYLSSHQHGTVRLVSCS